MKCGLVLDVILVVCTRTVGVDVVQEDLDVFGTCEGFSPVLHFTTLVYRAVAHLVDNRVSPHKDGPRVTLTEVDRDRPLTRRPVHVLLEDVPVFVHPSIGVSGFQI